jgi:hypothetical protein
MLWCYDVFVRTTLDLNEDAYQIAKTVAREQHTSLGKVISDFITGQFNKPAAPLPADKEEAFPTFRCVRRVTSEDVKALDEE